jgi:O-antigen/teichoic acid export membrane protein
MDQNTGKYIVLIGSFVVLVGVVVYFFGDKLHWIGRLPGDIRVERENTRFYFPITTMILLSLLLTLIINLIKRFF